MGLVVCAFAEAKVSSKHVHELWVAGSRSVWVGVSYDCERAMSSSMRVCAEVLVGCVSARIVLLTEAPNPSSSAKFV